MNKNKTTLNSKTKPPVVHKEKEIRRSSKQREKKSGVDNTQFRIYSFVLFKTEILFINFINVNNSAFSLSLVTQTIMISFALTDFEPWSSLCIGPRWRDASWMETNGWWKKKQSKEARTIFWWVLCLWWFELRDKWLSCLVTANKGNHNFIFSLFFLSVHFLHHFHFLHCNTRREEKEGDGPIGSGCKNYYLVLRLATPKIESKNTQKWKKRNEDRLRRDYGASWMVERRRKFYCDCLVFYACWGLLCTVNAQSATNTYR